MAKNGRTTDMTKTKIVAIGFTKSFSSITYAVKENKIPTAEIIKPKFNAVFFIFSFMMFFYYLTNLQILTLPFLKILTQPLFG